MQRCKYLKLSTDDDSVASYYLVKLGRIPVHNLWRIKWAPLFDISEIQFE